jgi:hypothetical protein
MQNAMVGSGIQGLLRTIQQYSNNLNLVITVVTTIKNLAADGISLFFTLSASFFHILFCTTPRVPFSSCPYEPSPESVPFF